MKPETEKTIALLNAAPLLRGGGTLDWSRYSVVESFDQALQLAASRAWERFYVNVSNGIFTIPVSRRIRAEAADNQAWTKLQESIWAALAPAQRAFRSVEWYNVTRFPFEGLLGDACVELEISHIIKPVFFYPLVFPVLCAGHFPCGWDGDPIPKDWSPLGPNDPLPENLILPRGKLMVHIIKPNA